MQLIWPILFWFSVTGVLYIYIGYPLLIAVLARLAPQTAPGEGYVEPFSVVIVGYNEADNLRGKLESIFQSAAAEHLVAVHVGSDGSTDNTDDVLKSLDDTRIVHHAFSTRRGKAAVINELIPLCETDIVIMTDARQRLDPGALAKLVNRFSDAEIGVVSGELMFESDDDTTVAGKGMGAYWTYEKFIRKHEGLFRSVPGATGALYALRKMYFKPIPEDSLLDDVAIPMRVVLQGVRCVFEEGARAFDRPSETAGQESIRKRRTIAGNVQVVMQCPAILSPVKNPIWLQYVSHKLARLLSPGLLLVALVSAFILRVSLVYGVAFWAQSAFYALAALAWCAQCAGLRTGILGIPLMFTSLNISTALALKDACTGRYVVTWDRSDKEVS
jgi:cellulose synthase/poly-beta-1,6-N-acetylglucosamine synthase-like glycosyltransferase